MDDNLPRGEIHSNSLVIVMDMEGFVVERVLVDTGSSVNILYKGVLENLGINKSRLKPIRMPLSGFTRYQVEAEGIVELNVELGSHPNVMKSTMEFIVVNISCVHNTILGRPGITRVGAVISMTHLCMKFYTPDGIGVMRGNQ